MSETTPVRVVVVHWNQPESCVATVGSLLASTVPTRVTIIDNASTTDARKALADGLGRFEGASVEVIDAPTNLGFGAGANLGLQRFLGDPDDGEWALLMPHDAEVSPDTIGTMLEVASSVPAAGLCCADVGDGMSPVLDPYFGGMVVPARSGRAGGAPAWEPVDYAHGTLMGLRRWCLEDVGLFDERYFSYCEEADLGLRARTAGWSVGLVRGAMVCNRDLGSSVWTVDYLQTRNTLLLVRQASGRYHAFIRACFGVVQVLRGVCSPGHRPVVFDATARVAGLRDFLLGRFGPPPSPGRG